MPVLLYYLSQMRRVFPILLILVFSLGPLSPTLGASEDTRLPACCRRHGAHRHRLSPLSMEWRTIPASAHRQRQSHAPGCRFRFYLERHHGLRRSIRIAQTPIGVYRLQVGAPDSRRSLRRSIASGTNPVVHVALPFASVTEFVEVEGATAQVDSVTPTTLVSREMIEETPGASRATSFAAITDYVPGAYMCHDMLHMRGGHQTSWLIDGVNIPNTNIAANVGPQIAPSDTDQIEVQRGSYAADIGDRTYGVFNVVPRNGFERNREAELHITGGNFYTGETALSAGDHSQKAAWYASVAAARSNYGLETPIAAVVHDATNSQSGFGSLLVNPNATNQLRFNGQLRQDFFQVPYDPNQNSWLNQLYDSSGLRDGQTERDSFLIADWVHTLSPSAMFEVAPFYHWNVANYDSKATDTPTATTWDRTSNYAGLQASVRGDVKRNNLAAGFYSFYQHDSSLFGVVFNDDSASTIHETDTASGGNVEGSFSDSLRVSRLAHFAGRSAPFLLSWRRH
jgi:hypothetical protein